MPKTAGTQHLASLQIFTSVFFVIASLPAPLLRGYAQVPPDDLAGVITKIGVAHDLAGDQDDGAKVHLVGTVTFYDPGKQELFLQDATGGIYVNTDRPYAFRIGDLVEVIGKTDASYRTEVSYGASLRVVGKGKSYSTPYVQYSDLITGSRDCLPVRVRGRLRAADIEQDERSTSAHLDLVMPGGRAEVYLSNSEGFNPQSLLDAEVEITGIAGASFDGKNQVTGLVIYGRDVGSVHVLGRPKVKVDQLPITPIDSVFQSRSVTDMSERVRVHGTVTYYQKGASVVIESDGKSIFIQTRQTNELTVGDVVDGFGFGSSADYSPSLRDGSVIKTGGHEWIAPRPVTYEQALSGLYSDNLILLTGRLISELQNDRSDVLVVDVGGHLVNAYVQGEKRRATAPVGSQISVAGICRIDAGGPWRAPYGFHLDLRDHDDVHLLAYPSWRTVTHLADLLGLIALVALTTATWAWVLRRRNIKQTLRIHSSMVVAQERSKILEQISSNTPAKVVLAGICESVRRLFPDLQCFYSLDTERIRPNPIEDKDGGQIRLSLLNTEAQQVGEVIVLHRRQEEIPAEQLELVTSLIELSALAVRQALLYDGLLHHSTHDTLTDLPNRRLCESRFASALENAMEEKNRLAIVYVDVNRFKHVNDKYGHKAGDLYLKLISQRLGGVIRHTDTVARIGGDEFLLIVPLTGSTDNAEALVARLQSCFDSPFVLDNVQIDGSASFGVAVYPDHGTTMEDLKRNADYAMYLAKRSENAYAQGADLAIVSADELHSALERNQFKLAYQPQFSAKGRLTGLEALLRLEDPILGTLTPDAFISVAERSGAIREIGLWVLKQALRDAIRWKLHEGEHVLMAVNVSMKQIEEPGFASMVLDALEDAAFPPDRLELEIIERNLLSTCPHVIGELDRLRAAGVRISLDDFGTGESCLTMLHTLPIDTIKIDRSFILAMENDPRVLPIVQAISFLGKSLGKRIVAEGLESIRPVEALLAMGPIEFQGYLLGRPVQAAQVDLVIADWRSAFKMPNGFRTEQRKLHDGEQ